MLSVDWKDASVSPTETGLLQVRVFLRDAKGAEWAALSEVLYGLSREDVPISGVQLSGDQLRFYVSADADIPAVQRAVAAKLDEFSAKSAERQREIRRQAEEMEARRRRAEDAAADAQARFRQPPV
jgi:hypothetical protein